MSEQNVEIVRGGYDAYFRGDAEAAFAAIDPEIEIHDHDLLDVGEYRGLEGLAQRQADWDASWKSWRWEAEEFIDADECVVAMLRLYAVGRSSGVKVERLDGVVWTLSAGMCVRLDYYGSREQALKAVGLKE